MKRNELIKIIETLVSREIKKQLPILLSEQFNVNTDMSDDPQYNTSNQTKYKTLSKNTILNEILNETQPFSREHHRDASNTTLNFDTRDLHSIANNKYTPTSKNGVGLGVKTGNDTLDKAFNRDYTKLVKAMTKK